MKKIDAYVWNGKNYVYEFSTNMFKTCKEFKLFLNMKYPLKDYKCNFAKD